MHETEEDLRRLQELLDRSYEHAGPHLLEVHAEPRRMGAAETVERLAGRLLVVVATTTSDGRPLTSPVDAVLFRGALHFGSSPDTLRLRHLRAQSSVSATWAPRREMAVTVHGEAVFVDVSASENAAFRRVLLDVYAPSVGPEWERFLDSGVAYHRIDARRMFAFHIR